MKARVIDHPKPSLASPKVYFEAVSDSPITWDMARAAQVELGYDPLDYGMTDFDCYASGSRLNRLTQARIRKTLPYRAIWSTCAIWKTKSAGLK